MKLFILPVILFSSLLLASCIVPAEQTTSGPPPAAASTPPSRQGSTYDEPPVEPATKGPAAEPARKKGHTK
ncbi:hypothetical protein KKF84_00655 [Myxococcota bacterium]|nr:hypothetical protein [Myxococcota bacterium]MBU1533794.1 hypothetical protein [Myxococcota bacterium]